MSSQNDSQVKRSQMSYRAEGKPSARMRVSTYRVKWKEGVTRAS